MDDADLLAALRAANDILRSTDPATLERAVPSCPGWTVEDLLEHTTQVQRWATRILLAPPGERPPRRVDDVPTGPDLIEFFAAGASALVDALTSVDLDREGYTFVGPRPARWWLRRQTHETVIHAWDRQSATGVPEPVDGAIAIDGIDELFEVYLDAPRVDTAGFAPEGESLHIHATDREGEWVVRLAPGSVVVTREHAKGDLALRGPAADLLLVLWGRRALADTEAQVFGAVDLLDRIRAVSPL